MSITSLRGSTLPNKSFRAGQAKTKNVVTIAPDTATTFANGASISAGGGGGGGGPTISNVSVTDSGYILSNTTPYIDSTGGYIKITGTGFAAGCTVYVGGSAATSTTFISATEVRAQVGAAASNAQAVYVVNTDSSVGIKLNAITYSGTPSWSTAASLGTQISDIAFSIPLSATSDSSIVYTLASGSSTPSGTTLYSNGVFAGTVTGITSDTNYSFTVVATDIENQLSSRAFTVSISSGDQYFYRTSLLLNGDANVWITDSSTNKFLPTVAADAKPTAFSPYNTNWSGYFDGTGDWLSIASNAAFAFGTGDFSIEFWAFPTSFATRQFFYDGITTDPSATIQISTDSSNLLILYVNGSIRIQQASGAMSLNTWNHVAVSRVSGSTRMFLNGAQVGSTYSDTNSYITAPLIVMHNYNQSTGSIGYISNLRVVKGVGAYTGNFTVPTSALQTTQSSGTNINAITAGQTVLLTCNSNRFIDASASPLTITKTGDSATKSFGPFTETDTTTGSGYFDISGDYLQYASNSAFAFGTSAYTVEAWVYPISVPGSAAAVFDAGSATGSFGFSIVNTTRQVFVNTYGTGQLSTLVTSTGLPLNAWSHIAVSRASTASNDTRIYINGALGGTGTDATNWTVTTTPMVGYNNAGANYYFNGYMTDMRVIKGSALYTTAFTPPTSSLSSVTNTQLLTLQYRRGENNHRFVDEAGNKYPAVRGGNATQGSFSPFSPAGWSHYFDGSSYYDFTASTTFNEFLTGDFTVECWLYYTGTDSFSGNPTALSVVATWSTSVSYEIEVQSGGVVRFAAGNSIPIDLKSSGAGLITANAWYHVAAARASGVTRLFINGANVAAHSGSVSISQAATNMRIGGFPGGGNRWTGYISDLRIVKGQAAYTANFTPATSSLTTTSQSITSANVFLGCNTNRFIDANTTPKTISSFTSAPKVQAFSPFRPSGSYTPSLHGGSAYFDGSGDYVSSVSTTGTLLPAASTSTFTIEGWLYPTTLGVLSWIVGDLQPTGGTNNVSVDLSSTNFVELYWYDGASKRATSTTAVILNQWNYFAIVVNNNAITIYVNSTTAGQGGTTTLTTRTLGTSGWSLGGWNSASYYTGYMSSIRWTNGVARTISSIPTAPHSFDANTTMLLNFTQGGVVDAAARTVMETAGTAKISNVASKFGIGSIYFGTKTDYLAIPATPSISTLGGDFTLEAWVYPADATLSNAWGIVDARQTAGSAAAWLWDLDTYSSGWQVRFYNGTAYRSTGRVQAAVWTHVAIVRSGSTMTFYINGSASGTATVSGTQAGATTNPIYIGTKDNATAAIGTLGYIDDLRITNGYARTITLPTQTFLTK